MDIADLIALGVTLVSALVAVASIVSGVYITWVYRKRHGDSLFLSRLFHRDIRVAVASAVILVYIALATAGYGLGRPWGSLIVAAAVILMMVGPIDDAVLWWNERRDRHKKERDEGSVSSP